jgi:drug/metabolite transporter (DMT)-like permease
MSGSDRSTHTKAVAALLLANLLWGLSFPLIKGLVYAHQQALPGSDNWFITACTIGPRFVLATAVMLLFAGRALGGLTPLERKQGVGLGLTAAAGMLFQNDGLQFTSASVSAFLTQFYAIMIPVWVALRARRAPPTVVWASCALVLVGAAVLAKFDPREMRLGRGEVETLLSSVFFMAQILWLERPEFAGNRVLPVTLVMFAIEAAIFLAMALATAPRAGDLLALWASPPWVGFTLALTVFCTLGAFTLMNTWQPKITATEAGLIYCVEPVFASVMALFLPGLFSAWAGFNYPNEQATLHLLVGGGLITVANVLLQFRPPPPTEAGGPARL